MAEKLTKTALKNELTRRIDWFEKSYGFSAEFNSVHDMAKQDNHHLVIAYGRYLALTEMRWQIQNNLYVDGYAC
ncbi:MAG: hypothetical protein OEY89_14130 [Gammaproteobacteria bacterium]|nr:hypothetical protein [Gammaproteobacteria bacterium]